MARTSLLFSVSFYPDKMSFNFNVMNLLNFKYAYSLIFFFQIKLILSQDQKKCSMLSVLNVQNLQFSFSDIPSLCSMFVGYILWRIFE